MMNLKILSIALFAGLCATSAHAQAAHVDVEEWVAMTQAEVETALTCKPDAKDGLQRFRNAAPVVVARNLRVYGLEMRAIYWEKKRRRYVIQVAAPENVARIFIPEKQYEFLSVAPAITEIRCR
jgi:hypothetical protein